MSKLTLDEAIKHCLEVAEENDLAAGTYELLAENNHNVYERLTAETNSSRCAECAADHRQLAEWLTELKKFREVYGVCPAYEMCIPECKEGYDAQIAEYKQLLKAAVEDIHKTYHHRDECCDICKNKQTCTINCAFVWQHEAEALKLIES